MKKVFLLLLYIIFSFNVLSETKFLPPDKAFIAKLTNKNKSIIIEFDIKPGYYLYKNKFQIESYPKIQLKKPIFSKSQIYEDNFFGKQYIFKDYLKIYIPYTGNINKFNINVKYQGCAEQGVCYNLSKHIFKIKGEGVYYPLKKKYFNKNKSNILNQNIALDNKFWINLIILFTVGIGLGFTACMYPLIPIIYSIILGNKDTSKKKAFILSLSYVEGIAFSYAIIGVIASLTGNLFNIFFQKPIFILISDILIFILALSMFGFFNIQIPLKIQNYLNKKIINIKGGKIFSVFIIGVITSLIIGPCIAPALAFILGYITTNKNYLLGGLYLYFLASGMGLPIILLCLLGENFLPKSGKWMEYIKILFGFILLFICIYIAKPFLSYKIILIIYFLLFISYSITLIYYSKFFNKIIRVLSVIFSILIIIYSFYFLILGINLKKTFIHNLLILNPNNKLNNVFTNERDLNKAIKQAFLKNPNKPVYIKFYAKWCVNCIKMEMLTFNADDIKKNIDMERFFTIDITKYTKEQQDLLKRYNLFGPPAIIILHKNNKISKPLIGFVNSKQLITWINNN